jgi:hypothetical protein
MDCSESCFLSTSGSRLSTSSSQTLVAVSFAAKRRIILPLEPAVSMQVTVTPFLASGEARSSLSDVVKSIRQALSQLRKIQKRQGNRKSNRVWSTSGSTNPGPTETVVASNLNYLFSIVRSGFIHV